VERALDVNGPYLANPRNLGRRWCAPEEALEVGSVMGERMDEAKGNIKEGFGKLTGDADMQAEGRAERDTAKARREVKGVGRQVKGRVEEGLGKVTGDDETRARGMADQMKGDAERAG
jgi:uncharacterized protein YjbJ (UPF0337 family)